MMTPKLFTELLAKWRKGTISVSEMDLFERAIESGEFQELTEDIFEGHLVANEFQHINVNGKEKILERLKKAQQVNYSRQVHRVHFLKTAWLRYAAAVLIIIGLGTVAYLWNHHKPVNTNEITNTQPSSHENDIAPGGQKALLTLADGSTILLDSAANGQLAIQGNSSIIKKDGQITYDSERGSLSPAGGSGSGRAGTEGGSASYNTMSTPRGGEYQLTLPDGTKAWLNAASSITYPTVFIENNRTVKIIGEVYFEVAKNPKQPFIVETIKDKIQVLGTHFNINAYPDENIIKTSLLEGSVKIGEKILIPGQAYINGKVFPTNIQEDIAWKNGFFNFNNTQLPDVMRQIARWYDVEVKFTGNVEAVKLSGEIGRSLTLDQLMRGLQRIDDMHFALQGKTLTVSP